MADLAKSVKIRGFTWSKITKLINKAEESIKHQQKNKVPVIIQSFEACAKIWAKQDKDTMQLQYFEMMQTQKRQWRRYWSTNLGLVIRSIPWKILKITLKSRNNAELVKMLKQENIESMSLKENQELPQRTLDCFDGSDITKFKPFVKSRPALWLGSIKSFVRSCSRMEFNVGSAFLEKIGAWPPSINPEEGEALENFSAFLTSCLNYAKDITALGQLNSPKEMLVIL